MPRGARSSRRSAPVTATDDASTERPRLRFTRAARITDRASYSRVFAGSKRTSDRLFTVLYRRNGGRAARLGLAISKKNCRLAVDRNRLKRLVRESFRRHHQQLTGLDIVVLNRPGAQIADNGRLFDSLATHWQRCSRDQFRGTHDG